jgi:hypothetical protein
MRVVGRQIRRVMANSPYCFGGINVKPKDGWFGFISHDENVKIGDF